MTLLATGAALGAAFAVAGGCDTLGSYLASGMGTAMATWLTTNGRVGKGSMLGTAGAVAGEGTIDFSKDGNDPIASALTNFNTFEDAALSFGVALASTIPAPDAAGVEHWTIIASAVMRHMMDHGGVNPLTYAYNPVTGGPVTGAGTFTFGTMVMSPLLSTDMGFSDAANIATWALISSAILGHIQTNAVALSLGFTCAPAAGSPLVGASLIT